jgi:MFS family permease
MSDEQRLYARPVRQLFIFALVLLLITQVALSLYAWRLAEDRLLPELGRKAQATARSLSGKLDRALDYGIPLARLEGVPDFFADVLKQNSDLAYLRVSDAHGATLYGSVQPDSSPDDEFLDTAVPLLLNGASVGALHVGVDKRYVAARVRELRYDIGIVLLTSLLIAFEILWFVVTLNFTVPMRQIVARMMRIAAGDFRQRPQAADGASLASRLDGITRRVNQGFESLLHKAAAAPQADPRRQAKAQTTLQRLRGIYHFGESAADGDLTQQRVVLVRVLSFLFMFAEMLSRPFLPVYAASLTAKGGAAAAAPPPDGLLASLPITAFLLGMALSMPMAGRWSDRVGRRNSYMAGALLVSAGLAATGLIPVYYALVAARAATGVGYALMFMSCQGYVFDNTDASNRAKGMALFVGSIMVAEICSPAVGGILADRIGYQLVFIFGAAVALIAALLAGAVLDNRRAQESAPSAAPANTRSTAMLRLAHNRRFLALSILSGIPAKFLYSGFLIFLVPLLLTSLDCTKSEIGRYTMLYGLSCLALGPLFARLADRYNAYAMLVAAGGLLTGAGMLPILQGASADLVMLGVAALGIGQAMSISAQLVLVARVTQAEAQDMGTGPIVGMFRLLERLGAAAGPVATGALVAHFGPQQAMAALGAFGLGTSLLFVLAFRQRGSIAGLTGGASA